MRLIGRAKGNLIDVPTKTGYPVWQMGVTVSRKTSLRKNTHLASRSAYLYDLTMSSSLSRSSLT